MGNYNIYIEGVGSHHNGKLSVDADLKAAQFVQHLIDTGHTVSVAEFRRTNGEGQVVADNLIEVAAAYTAANTTTTADMPRE